MLRPPSAPLHPQSPPPPSPASPGTRASPSSSPPQTAPPHPETQTSPPQPSNRSASPAPMCSLSICATSCDTYTDSTDVPPPSAAVAAVAASPAGAPLAACSISTAARIAVVAATPRCAMNRRNRAVPRIQCLLRRIQRLPPDPRHFCERLILKEAQHQHLPLRLVQLQQPLIQQPFQFCPFHKVRFGGNSHRHHQFFTSVISCGPFSRSPLHWSTRIQPTGITSRPEQPRSEDLQPCAPEE